MKIAVLSDIHANIQALTAVLHDCKTQQVDEYWLLGDYVDYGASVIETVSLLSSLNAKHIIAGNHDACLYNNEIKPSETPHGKESYEYTKRIVNSNPKSFAWLESITDIPMIHIPEKKTLLVHGTPTDPYWGRFYLDKNADFLFEEMEKTGVNFMFLGHSHINFRLTKNGKVIINPGSVGQPRNGFPQAQYAIIDNDAIEFRRVEYDVDAAVAAIQKAGLPEYLWKRLYKGI
jgi:putative phosphoesterase